MVYNKHSKRKEKNRKEIECKVSENTTHIKENTHINLCVYLNIYISIYTHIHIEGNNAHV